MHRIKPQHRHALSGQIRLMKKFHQLGRIWLAGGVNLRVGFNQSWVILLISYPSGRLNGKKIILAGDLLPGGAHNPNTLCLHPGWKSHLQLNRRKHGFAQIIRIITPLQFHHIVSHELTQNQISRGEPDRMLDLISILPLGTYLRRR